MKRGRNIEPDGNRTKTPQAWLGRFGGLGSGAGFRLAQRSVNGLLTSTWCVLLRAREAVFGKGAAAYG
jgi:hypothetical protein